MIEYISYIILHFVFCTLYFVLIQRPAFFYRNRCVSNTKVGTGDLCKVTSVGLKTDLAGAAYITAPVFLTLWVLSYLNIGDIRIILLCVEALVALVLSLITIGDTVLYGYWQFRLDVSVFAYLKSIKGALASVTATYILVALAVVILLAAAIMGAFYILGAICGVYTAQIPMHSAWAVLGDTGVFVLLAGWLFANIRGIKHRPNSPYQLYYSTNMYLNHTAVNPVFNLAYSASIKSKESDKFKVFDEKECDETIKSMLPNKGITQVSLLKNKRPNILIIVWESLSSYFTEPLGGKSGVTENLDSLCQEGILFTHVDAGSWRTDPAMVCILSAYPGQPTTSIMRDTHKLPYLPSLPRTLKANGYKTSIVHGGPLSYMHMIDYYHALGHDRITGIDDMPKDAPRCAWGVHDGYMFDWLYDDIVSRPKSDQPWFTTFLTLSSHQPYIVPYKKLDNEIDNSYAYTDDAFGRFIDKLKKTDVWDDTLIVVLGDHGININFLPMARHKQPHIPLLFLGGAIKEPRHIDTMMSQTDLAGTLLGQLGIDHKDFKFSRDVLADTYTQPFTINIYNNGFLYRDETGYTEYDNVAQRSVDGTDSRRERLGRMFMQYMMDDLGKLSHRE